MSHVFRYGGQYFRVQVAEVASYNEPDQTVFVSWCSESFNDVKDMPDQALSRFIEGPPVAKYSDALERAHDWIKRNWDRPRLRPAAQEAVGGGVVYTVRLHKGASELECRFNEFGDAKAFARAAQNMSGVTKVGITNNESPEYLIVWEKPS